MIESPANPADNETASTAKGPQLMLQQIYLKDCSYEAPSGPLIPAGEWKPEFSLNLNTASREVGPETLEVVLTVRVEAKVGAKVAYLVELKQAGLFQIRHCGADQMKHVVGSVCPTILFPYARAACSDLVMQGGFPQFLLPPVNFEALLDGHQMEAAQGAAN
jgi:preprotein translocase subunit SecB